MRARSRQSGQAMVLVAFALIALIGSAALVLLAGSFEWQANQLQQLADQAALDSAMKIGVGCSAASATTVITEADNFVGTQRTRTGSLAVAAGTCATPYKGTDTFAGGLSETVNYPYSAHQQQVEVILTLSLPISFGGELGASNTTVTRRAVAQQLTGSVPAVSATNLGCTSGQVNIAGSIAAQNLITRAGTCAIYAHQRYDGTSGTYSDLGNVSVYTDGQTWSAPGTCTALLNTGSASAICADGYELSGHTSPACGAVGTSYLSAGDAAIDANPCSAGVAPQPVPPASTTLPPDPNTDAPAIATLPGNTACSAATTYPALVVAGTTVGSAEVGTPAPVKDAGGFYHFKPSCYGYLDFTSMVSAAIANRQIGARIGPIKHFITPTIASGSVAGSLLVATINSAETPSKFAAPANWVEAAQVDTASSGRTEIWYLPVAFNTGGITGATFTINPATINADAQLSEWTGAAALDQSGTAVNAGSTSASVSTAGATTQAGELVITAAGFNKAVGGQTYTQGAGWTNIAKDTANGFASDYRLNLPAGIDTETVTGNPATAWSLAIATFKTASANTGAVFDPGFYYFNGNGTPGGGGGICLNGGELLGQDISLEFVNSAGFSSGNCAVGGATACTAAGCGFGSTPCSISACPPNVAEDSSSGSGYTWFAAPCSAAPAGDASSCPGSAWCPVGDRACWNLLVYAPATITGQVAFKGAFQSSWLLGSIYWPGTCTYADNGTATIAGSVSCGTLSLSAGAGAGVAIGSDYGVSTALVEAVLVE